MKETVEEETNHLLDQFYQNEVVERREKLRTIEQAVNVMRTSRYFKRWKDELIGRQRLKRSMYTFPPAPSLELPQQQLKVSSTSDDFPAYPRGNRLFPVEIRRHPLIA